jgi:hypothetical protein
VRESDMGNLDDLLDLVGCQLAVPLHRKPGRTVETGQTQTQTQGAKSKADGNWRSSSGVVRIPKASLSYPVGGSWSGHLDG